jgi:hypothetical protein
MEPSLYVETTIPSFIIGEVSPVLATAAHQVTTRLWWEERRHQYRLFISSLVEEELAEGKATYAQQRLALVANLTRLVIVPEVAHVANFFFNYLHLPEAAGPDATHLAIASYYSIDYLLTWNLKHLANGRVRRALDRLSKSNELFVPTICTPEEMLDWKDDIW